MKQVPDYDREPEGGARCEACFRFSFTRTWKKLIELDLSSFTTTLSISPYKKSALLFRVGGEFQGFKEFNFKKQEGYKRSIELSRGYGLYRQTFCGCEFNR